MSNIRKDSNLHDDTTMGGVFSTPENQCVTIAHMSRSPSPNPPIPLKIHPREMNRGWRRVEARGARSPRAGTDAERTKETRVTAHAVRAKSIGTLAKVGSSRV